MARPPRSDPSAAALLPRTVRLPEDSSAPRVAREAVDEWLCGVEPGVRLDARSVVSELVMSAVEQGSAPVELSLERRGERVRIEVADAGEPSGSPASGVLEPAHRIVNDLVARWGVRGDAAHVWFELRVGGLARSDGSNP